VYKGRGLIQLTARSNYKAFGKMLRLDLEGNPDLATQPDIAVKLACLFWRHKHINHFCDNDDIIHVTRRVNGGLNGLAQRKTYLARAKAALGGETVSPMVWTGSDTPPLINYA
jgi:putative chitinase